MQPLSFQEKGVTEAHLNVASASFTQFTRYNESYFEDTQLEDE